MNGVGWRTALLMTMPPLLWAGNVIVGRLIVGSVPPVALNALRWVLAGLILLPVCGLLALLAIGGGAHRLRDASPRRERVVLVLDGLLVTGSLLALTWAAVLEPQLAPAGSGAGSPSVLTATSSPNSLT